MVTKTATQPRTAHYIRADQVRALNELVAKKKITSKSEFVRDAIDDRLKNRFGIESWRENGV